MKVDGIDYGLETPWEIDVPDDSIVIENTDESRIPPALTDVPQAVRDAIRNPMGTAPLADHLPFGAIVKGLDPDDLKDAETRRRLRELWIREGVLVFRGLEGESAHLELSRCFGKLMVHPSKEAHTANPEIIDLRYKPETGWLMSVDGNMRGAWLPWHSDLVFVDQINRGGILRPIALPSHLGETGFIDKIAACSALPSISRRRRAASR